MRLVQHKKERAHEKTREKAHYLSFTSSRRVDGDDILSTPEKQLQKGIVTIKSRIVEHALRAFSMPSIGELVDQGKLFLLLLPRTNGNFGSARRRRETSPRAVLRQRRKVGDRNRDVHQHLTE